MLDIKDLSEVILSFQPMTHKKLQKLCYYTYAWHLVMFNEKICDTDFEAWVHGPVSPELYYYYKQYGWNIIRKFDKAVNVSKQKYNFIAKIMEIYGEFNAEQLEDMTHTELPWIRARQGLSKYAYSDNLIMSEDIRTYYPLENKYIFNEFKNFLTQQKSKI